MLTKILCCFDSLKSFSEVVVQRCSYEEVVAKQLNKIKPRHGCPPVNLLHIYRTPFSKNTSGWMLLGFP